MEPADAARKYAVEVHRETIGAVLDAADAVAAGLDQPAPRDEAARALAGAIGDETRAALVDLLGGAVSATGRELLAEPVPASPYLVVTARGPLVRATLADGRLILLVRAFERTEWGYVRADGDPSAAVEARFRRRP